MSHFQLNDISTAHHAAWERADHHPELVGVDIDLERFLANDVTEVQDPNPNPNPNLKDAVYGYLKGDAGVYVDDQVNVILGCGTPFTKPSDNGGDESGDVGVNVCAYFLGRWWLFSGMSRSICDELEVV